MLDHDYPRNEPNETPLFIRRVVQRTIGYGLKLHYEPLKVAPPELFVLLARIGSDERPDDNPF